MAVASHTTRLHAVVKYRPGSGFPWEVYITLPDMMQERVRFFRDLDIAAAFAARVNEAKVEISE